MTDEPLQATITQRGILFAPDNEILIVQRASDDGWELPGGRIDHTENVIPALRREIREETTLSPRVISPVHTLAWRNNDNDGRFGVYYYCQTTNPSIELSAEHNDFQWLSPKDACSHLSNPQQTAVEKALEYHQLKD